MQSILFYSLPTHGTFYPELVNMLEQAATEHGSVEALFSQFDFLALSRVLGDKRAARMLADDAASFLFT
jgi:Utp25, U3 small nucleolar RNA-associated SSU processome protein 25